MEPSSILFLVFLWIATAFAVIFFGWKRHGRSAGLLFAYLCNFGILHWVGAAIYFRSWPGASDPEVTKLGVAESTYGILAFAVGSVLLAPSLIRRFRIGQNAEVNQLPHRQLPMAYLLLGVLSFFLFSTELSSLRSIGAVISVSQQFIVVGICLNCRAAWLSGRTADVWTWLGAGLFLPFVTMISSGFLGFGALACFTILCFVSTLFRSRWRFAAGTLVLGVLFLSLYVTYMRDRGEIRQAVWGGQSLELRTGSVYSMVSNLELFNPFNDQHLERIDLRLNQNFLVGKAVEHMSVQGGFAKGETIRDAALAIIPRAIWPDKPVSAGSGTLVSRFTGIRFAYGTSVGIGQVMEWYVNFGRLGVIAWFLAVGAILTMVDAIAGSKLRTGDWLSFSKWYLPSLALLNIGGSLVEVTASMAATICVVFMVNEIVLRRLQTKQKRNRNKAVDVSLRISRPGSAVRLGRGAGRI
jgi:hypothetical protein